MNILFLGDSLIEFFEWQERFPGHSVANLGVAGESVAGLLSRVMQVSEIVPRADLVFIMSGINNVAMGDIEFISYYRIIIEKLSEKYPGAGIYAHSLLPTVVDFINNKSIREVNIMLETLAGETGVNFLNIYKRFMQAGGNLPIKEYFMCDGVHLSKAGYDVWAGVVEGVIVNHSSGR